MGKSRLTADVFWAMEAEDPDGVWKDTILFWKDDSGRGIGLVACEDGNSEGSDWYGRLVFERADGTKGLEIYGPMTKLMVGECVSDAAEREFPKSHITYVGKRSPGLTPAPQGVAHAATAQREDVTEELRNCGTKKLEDHMPKGGANKLTEEQIGERIKSVIGLTRQMNAKGQYPNQKHYATLIGISTGPMSVFMRAHQAELAKLGLRGGGRKGYYLEGFEAPGKTNQTTETQGHREKKERSVSRPAAEPPHGAKSATKEANLLRMVIHAPGDVLSVIAEFDNATFGKVLDCVKAQGVNLRIQCGDGEEQEL